MKIFINYIALYIISNVLIKSRIRNPRGKECLWHGLGDFYFLSLWALWKSEKKSNYYLIHQCDYEGKVWWRFISMALHLGERLAMMIPENLSTMLRSSDKASTCMCYTVVLFFSRTLFYWCTNILEIFSLPYIFPRRKINII